MEESPSLFTSLPDDIVLNVLARVPRRYHTTLCCVSKKLRSIVRSSELHKTRSLLGKDCFYVCFQDFGSLSLTDHWFSLTENRRLVSIPFTSPPESYFAALMVGSEIYFVGGFVNPSRSMWILDSRSGKLHQGPSMLVATNYPVVGIVDDKIYIIGGYITKNEEIQAQVFDPKTQTWKIAANPSVEVQNTWMNVLNQSLDRKIYARTNERTATVYDPRDGNCEIIELPSDFFYYCSEDLCVVDNLLYIHHSNFGLMWYNPKDKKWRKILGLYFNKFYNIHHCDFSMAEYNGKLALLWHDIEKMEIWCAMISLHRSGVVEVQGRVEWSNCILSKVPSNYYMKHCLCPAD